MALEITIPTLVAQELIGRVNRNSLLQSQDSPQSARRHYDSLDEAAEKRVAKIAPNAQPLITAIKEHKPDLKNLRAMAGHGRASTPDGKDVSVIHINPNANSAFYAHELGHAVSQKTKAGKFVNDVKHLFRKNPKLARALAMSLPASAAITGAALQEGDDDLAASLAIAAAAASPTLIDEALATKNALAIMQDAGTRATLGQRGRLAGGYLSYLAPVIIAGSVGNSVGNFADDYTALYDL